VSSNVVSSNLFIEIVCRYISTAKQYSKLVNDRPMTAKDTAVFWVEYVLRNRGAPHLHYPGADLNFLQYNSIDIIGFILVVIYAMIQIGKIIWRKIFGGKPGKTAVKHKRN
jgi:glucuronosyltransferase